VTARFVLYVEPFELTRTSTWDGNSVAVGLGSWAGGAIDGTEAAVLFVNDGYRNSTAAHLTRDEVVALLAQLNEVALAMGEPL